MTRSSGVWKHEDAALILIDYQKEMFETVRSETPAELIDLNVRLLIKAAKAFNMPIVLSTVGTAIAIYIAKAITGLRVAPEVEQEGLDIGEHGERAYN